MSSAIVYVFTLAFVPLNPNPHGFVKPLKQKSYLAKKIFSKAFLILKK
jgi:hypothetical protein